MPRHHIRDRELHTSQNDFGRLLALLVAAFVLSGVDNSASIRLATGLLTFGALMSVFATTRLKENILTLAILVPASIGGIVLIVLPTGEVPNSIGASLEVIVMGAITVAVIRTIIRVQIVTVQTIYGVIAAYFLLGQTFAWMYAAIPGFFADEMLLGLDDGTLPVYYSYTVLTTLGFGDITPNGSLMERVTIIEALTGQLFLATLLARFVTLFSRRTPDDTAKS